MRLPWLADVLRDAGREVVELSGWQTRGRELDVVYGVVVHDTVTTTGWSDARVDSLLVNGKKGTPGPLYQLGVDRAGTFRIIASGRANHAGYSRPWGNSSIGIGVYCAGGLQGREEPWNDAQYESVTIGARAILDHLDLGPSSHYNPRVAGHKEIDTRGKVDPYNIHMPRLREAVANEETDMPTHPVAIVAEGDVDNGAGHMAAAILSAQLGLDVPVLTHSQAKGNVGHALLVGGGAAAHAGEYPSHVVVTGGDRRATGVALARRLGLPA